MTVEELLGRLNGVQPSGPGQWMASCPAHDDRIPSLSVSDGKQGVVFHCHAGCAQDAVASALGVDFKELFYENGATRSKIVATYDYVDEGGTLLFQVVRLSPKAFRQRRPDGLGGWEWTTGGTRKVLYRLPQLLEAAALDKVVYVVEGEKDVEAVEGAGGVATTNPGGAGRWLPEYSESLREAQVRVVADKDEPGRAHALQVAKSLEGIAETIEVVEARQGKDASDHLSAGFGLDDFELVGDLPAVNAECDSEPLTVNDFHAYMPEHKYIFAPTRALWPAASVDARLGRIATTRGRSVKATRWLDQNRPVEQMTWSPGDPMLIEDRIISDGGWIERFGVNCYNLYRPPAIALGDASQAEPWLQHLRKIYPDSHTEIVRWLAHRVQRPGEKVNHALVLGGLQGIGKDSLLEPVKYAVGPWNFQEVSPTQLLGRFNGFIKSVILRVSEARDLGDSDRYGFYEHLKALTASPPDVLRCDEKNIREYSVPNVSGIVITSNHKAGGIHLPADDRRHYVAWSELSKDDFEETYWRKLWEWYRSGGIGHVAAYLHVYNDSIRLTVRPLAVGRA